MIPLAPDERIIQVIRRHWFVLVRPGLGLAALVLVALLAPLGARALPDLGSRGWAYTSFFTSLYLMGVLLWALVRWADYYLDGWIVTTRCLIDVDQRGLSHREISETTLDRIQDVTVEISGIAATVLGFGDIKVETAGHGPLLISGVPRVHELKDLLLRSAAP